MLSLALRNLFHDRIRLAVTLTGVVFAVVLIAIQIGLFIGFRTTISNVIDRSNADVWIGSRHITHIETGTRIPRRILYEALATPGVDMAVRRIVQFSRWKRPDGADETVEIVGVDGDTTVGGPWNVVAGRVEDLRGPDAVMIDLLYRKKLGVANVGDVCEIEGHRARVVGFTQGIRTFTTAPLVFTSFKSAQAYTHMTGDETTFVLVKTAAGSAPSLICRRLAARLKDVDVFTTAEFSSLTRTYWMFGTGAGITVLVAATLGLLVGIAIVAQTIYSATIDHVREYGTLKAIGAENHYVCAVILKQAATSAVLGYAVGISVAASAARFSQHTGAAILLPGPAIAGMFILTLLMCLAASMVSIKRVLKIEPAMVFKA
jgi:putative ABC transport system permease protein